MNVALRHTFRLVGLALVIATVWLPREGQAKDAPKSVSALNSALADSTVLHNKVVYVDFWASWCAPCKQSLPWMRELLARDAKKGLEIVAVNVDRKPSDARDFMDHLKSPLQEVTESPAAWNNLFQGVVFDSSWTLAKLYGLDALPTSFVYGRDGLLRKEHQGFEIKDTLTLDSILTSLLAENMQK